MISSHNFHNVDKCRPTHISLGLKKFISSVCITLPPMLGLPYAASFLCNNILKSFLCNNILNISLDVVTDMLNTHIAHELQLTVVADFIEMLNRNELSMMQMTQEEATLHAAVLEKNCDKLLAAYPGEISCSKAYGMAHGYWKGINLNCVYVDSGDICVPALAMGEVSADSDPAVA